MAERVEILLGLGSNLGDPPRQLAEALRLLKEVVQIETISSLYRTAPIGFRDQPDFFNIVCAAATELPLTGVLEENQRIERRLGRDRPFPNAPRRIDIDLLAYGDHVVETPSATVPHPRLHTRGFVLVPLAEIRPGWVHPKLGQSAAALLTRLGESERVERVGPLE